LGEGKGEKIEEEIANEGGRIVLPSSMKGTGKKGKGKGEKALLYLEIKRGGEDHKGNGEGEHCLNLWLEKEKRRGCMELTILSITAGEEKREKKEGRGERGIFVFDSVERRRLCVP